MTLSKDQVDQIATSLNVHVQILDLLRRNFPDAAEDITALKAGAVSSLQHLAEEAVNG